jgi:tetratricopeptide (TPR) repeat protein
VPTLVGDNLTLTREILNTRSKTLIRTLQLDHRVYYAYFGRGLIYLRMLDFDRAISAFNELIRLDEKLESSFTFRAIGGKGVAHRQKGDLEEAIASFSELIRLDPNDDETRARLGEAYLQQGNIDRAIAEYSEAIKNTVALYNRRGYYMLRGNAYLLKNEFKEAIADFNRAISIAPSTAAYVGRGDAYRKMGNEKQAIADYNQAKQITRQPAETKIP